MPDTDACFWFAGLCLSRKVDLGLIIPLILFGVGALLSARTDRLKSKVIRRQYLVALREEIGLNIEILDKSVRVFPARAELSSFMKEREHNRPLITCTYYSVIFRAKTDVLQYLPDILIKSIVEFYGTLDQITVDVQGINFGAFETISLGGKEDFIMLISTQEQIALQQGKSIRDAIDLHITDMFGAPKQ